MRPILLASFSVNHSAPSGPAVIPSGRLIGVGVRYSVTDAEVAAGDNSAASKPISAGHERFICTSLARPAVSSVLLAGADHARLVGQDHGLHAVAQAQFREHMRHVGLDRAVADDEA